MVTRVMNIHMNSHVNDAILEKKSVSVASRLGVRSKYQILHCPIFASRKLIEPIKNYSLPLCRAESEKNLALPTFTACVSFTIWEITRALQKPQREIIQTLICFVSNLRKRWPCRSHFGKPVNPRRWWTIDLQSPIVVDKWSIWSNPHGKSDAV